MTKPVVANPVTASSPTVDRLHKVFSNVEATTNLGTVAMYTNVYLLTVRIPKIKKKYLKKKNFLKRGSRKK